MTVLTAEIIVGKYHSFLSVAMWSSINVNSWSGWTNDQANSLSFAICATIFDPSVVFPEMIIAGIIMFVLFHYRPAYYVEDARNGEGSLNCMQPALYKL